jgi:hypothetical protein
MLEDWYIFYVKYFLYLLWNVCPTRFPFPPITISYKKPEVPESVNNCVIASDSALTSNFKVWSSDGVMQNSESATCWYDPGLAYIHK